MRVVLTSHLFPPDDVTGVERYTKTLALELAKGGHTVTVITRRPVPEVRDAYLERERLQRGICLYRIVGGKWGGTRCLVHHERLEQLFKLALIESAPEVVHFNHLCNFSPRSVEIADRLGAAVVHGVHDFNYCCPLVHLVKRSGEICRGPDGGRECARTCFEHEGDKATLRWGLRAMYFRRLLAIGGAIICPSRFVAAHLEAFGADAARIRVIPNGLWISSADGPEEKPAAKADLAPVERGNAGRSSLNLAYLGAVVPHKGLHVLLQALGIAKLPSVDLFVHGPDPKADYSCRAHEQARLLAGVKTHWRGAYYPHELPDLLRDIDCVVTPSVVPETYSFVAREAQVRGAPVLVSRLGALPDSVVEGETGFTFAPNRPGELAALLRRLAMEDGLLAHLRAGVRRACFPSVAEHAQAVLELYHEAVENKRRSRPAPSGALSEIDFLQGALIGLGLAH